MREILLSFQLLMGINVLLFFIALFLLLIYVSINKMVKKGVETVDLWQKMASRVGVGVPAKADLLQTEGAAAPAVYVQGERPEVVAAAMGAIFFALEGGDGRHFDETSGGIQNSWAQAGRNRLMQARNDFATNKRRKVR
jgi:hypothetical protein